MDRLTLLAAARAAGLTIYVDGGRLVVRGPRSAEPLARELLSRKREVLAAPIAPLGTGTIARAGGNSRVAPDAVLFSAPPQGELGIARYRVLDQALPEVLDERRAFDDPAVLRRVAAMRARHHLEPGKPLPFLTVRDLPPGSDGCRSCGAPIVPAPNGLAVRCQPCVIAATLALQGFEAGSSRHADSAEASPPASHPPDIRDDDADTVPPRSACPGLLARVNALRVGRGVPPLGRVLVAAMMGPQGCLGCGRTASFRPGQPLICAECEREEGGR